MNIRKFIGATSRDALRLVREALGADAVVLSNRTNDDGSVEIVALADTDLAAIAPGAGDGAGNNANANGNGQGAAGSYGAGLASRPQGGQDADGAHVSLGAHAAAGYPMLAASMSQAAQPAPMSGMMPANPYANGMPDVFSAVFGASAEVGATNAEGKPVDTFAPAAISDVGALTTAAAAAPAGKLALREPRVEMKPLHTAAAKAGAMSPGTTHSASPAAANGAAAAGSSASRTPESSPTMVESHPWLIEHAHRIAAQQRAAHTASPTRSHALTPSAAAAKGLGTPGKILSPEELASAEVPDWAQEAAEAAARRVIPRIAPAFEGVAASTKARGADGAGASEGAAAVADAVRARIEEVVSSTVMNELSSLRGMMEEQFAGLLWGDRQRRSPVQGTLTKQLFAAGFSAQLVRMVIDNLPAVENVDAGMDWIQSVLAANLPVLENEDELMERGGVFALMGPTGVGKTTTTAKLAARCVMRFGASKVALLTTDSYRIGGHEQLRIFGKILGVSVHAVKDAADLQLALAELRNKHIVLIDTIGMSQRDRTVSDQIAMLCGAGHPVQRLLLLNATSHGDTLNEVVQAYQSADGQPELAGCILTKLDEATNLGGVLDTVIRYKLPVHYVSTGQKVPENLYVATKKFLIKSAFCIPRDGSPFVPHDDDIPALLSALSTRSTAELHEVRFG
ncbi:flagellar biosynthesis protein FlhF [Trinickia symbiotica]|uniref:Flagellar biosynthesis protein FlhF n=1 Tax=Trinickia symbiotica TaxID=863227 RepID=A0A2N7X7F9_9BURK|nr:flagellar biosynthesis protein FlhF [Trinickia symbiotica]PMS37472.1 flagellar biosynthesis protein FlhF [Trinickia symbiotica]PPK44125.1 flagellar biosynthesis protein FlhF [Trinickia symbiotica]